MKKAKCKCGHKIVFYPIYRHNIDVGKWKHTTDDIWFADSCRSAGNDCDCEKPELQQPHKRSKF